MNERAWLIADELERHADELHIDVRHLPCGTRVLDCGASAPGGLGAGIALSEICMGGLGHVSYATLAIGQQHMAGVEVWTDQPVVSCMASQYAGWAIKVGKFFAMGSGPLRAHTRTEGESDLFSRLGYTETATRGVLVLETRATVDDAVAKHVAERARIDTAQITFVVAPTASTAGGVQIAARSVETGMHKMDVLGFDVTRVVHGSGSAPIPPVAANDGVALGRTNDAILYGSVARYTVDATDEELADLVPRMPAVSSRDYGTPFFEIFRRYEFDFYKIDPLLFSPAVVEITSSRSGRTFQAGRLNEEVLTRSLFG